MIDREDCLRLLKELVQGSPADQTEALLLTEESSLTRFARSSIHQHVSEKNLTLTLRVVRGKRISVLSTNRIDKISLKEILRKAISLTEVQKPKEDFISLPSPKPIPEVKTYCHEIRSLNPNRKVKLIKDLLKIVNGKGFHASGAFSNGEVELAIVNSLGIEAYQSFSDLFLHLIVENEKSCGYASLVARSPDNLDVENLAREAIGKTSEKEPLQIEPGEYEVVLEPYAVSDLLSFLGYLGFHALALKEG